MELIGKIAGGVVIFVTGLFGAHHPETNTPIPTIEKTATSVTATAPVVHQTKTENVPAGWKTYREEKHGFTINLPNNLSVETPRQDGKYGTIVISGKSPTGHLPIFAELSTILDKDTDFSLGKGGCLKACTAFNHALKNASQKKTVTFGGVRGYLWATQFKAEGISQIDAISGEVASSDGNYHLHIIIRDVPNNELTKYMSLLEQIVESAKFTGAVSEVSAI